MLEKDFEFVLNNHPNTVEASYKGTSTVGIFDQTQEKLFSNDGSYFYAKTIDFTYLTNKLPDVNTKTDKFIRINGKDYLIRSNLKENKYITTLTLEEKL